MNEKHISSTFESPTYLQALSADSEYVLDEDDLKELDNEYIDINTPTYVMFFAASGRTWSQMSLEIIGIQSGDVDQSGIYSPLGDGGAAIQQGTTDSSGVGDVGASAAVGTVTATNAARAKIAENIAKNIGETGFKDAVKIAGKTLVKGPSVANVGELGFAVLVQPELKGLTGGKAATKVLAKASGKVLAKGAIRVLGAKVIPFVGWGVTAVEAGVGAYKIWFGKKPFVATVMIADPNQFSSKCNEYKQLSEVEKERSIDKYYNEFRNPILQKGVV